MQQLRVRLGNACLLRLINQAWVPEVYVFVDTSFGKDKEQINDVSPDTVLWSRMYSCFHQEPNPSSYLAILSVVLILLIPKLLLTYIVIVERNVAAPFRISYQTIIRIVLASCKWYRSLGRITRVPRRTRHLWFCLNLLEKIVLSVQPNRKNDKNRVTLLDRIGFLSSTGLAGYQAPSQHDVCHPNFQVPIRFTLSNFEFWWPLAIILVLPLPITWKPVWLQDAIRGIASVAVAQNFQNAKARVEAEKLTRFPFDRGKGQN